MLTYGVFKNFSFRPPSITADFQVNEIGAKHRRSWYAGRPGFKFPPMEESGEGVLEWLDIFKAVHAYADSRPARPFVMAELGAGFGRALVDGICAIRQIAPDAAYRGIAVEADPTHFEWIKTNLADNGIQQKNISLFDCVVSGEEKTVYFWHGDPDNWYGQSVMDAGMLKHIQEKPADQRKYNAFIREPNIIDRLFGPKPIRRVTPVRSITLETALAGVGIVDLIDMDIQGAEADVICSSLSLLKQRVLRLHIGTHSHDIESRIRDTLSPDWRNEADFGCNGKSDTPFGVIDFGDGVQSWFNSSLYEKLS